MRAAFLSETSDGLAITVGEQPQPAPRAGEVLVRVYGAGITPTELSWYPSTHTQDGEKRAGAIPSHEFSGVVSAVGSGATDFPIGAEVFGMNDWFAQGATAEYVIALPTQIWRKPKTLSHAEAAAVPIGALTAWQGLFTRAKLQGEDRVLVHGGAGAVGAFAIQLAKMHGADVVATCGAKDMEFVRGLGADEVIDYKATRLESLMPEVDVLFDTVGGETLQRSWSLLKPTGRAVTIVESADAEKDARIKAAFFIVTPEKEQLSMLATLIDGGFLRPFVGATVPLDDTAAAFARTIERKEGRGKVVVDPRA